MPNSVMIGSKDVFAVEYTFFEGTHDTEISMYVNGQNILAFERDGRILTTRWNLDDLAKWLRNFVDNMADDPYPVDVKGRYAAMKDSSARDFDSDDDDVFDAYYEKLYEWNLRHRWHTEANGAILADVFFEQVSGTVEISWNNQNAEPYVRYEQILGGASVPKEVFTNVIDGFLKAYAEAWFC